MENENKSAIYGKKVFFMTQNRKLIETIKTRLITMEYEIYILDNYRRIKNILKENPDSILFITPDTQLTFFGWKNLIKSIKSDETFKNVKISVITEKLRPKDIEEYTEELHLDTDIEIIKTDQKYVDLEDTFRFVVKTLDMFEAKGLRQYVRASCHNDKASEIYWLDNDKLHKLKIFDISSAGIAIKLPAKNSQALKVNQSLTNAKIVLKNKHVPVMLDIEMIKPANDYFIAVAMFQMGIDKNSLNEVRNYVFDRLAEDLDLRMESLREDESDYETVVVESEEKSE